MYQPTTLTDTEKDRLFEKRSGHLSSQESQNEYSPRLLVWFTEDGSPDWKSGFVESKAPYPDSYWIITANSERRLRRNFHDLKPHSAPFSYRLPLTTLPHDRPSPVILHPYIEGKEKQTVTTTVPRAPTCNPSAQNQNNSKKQGHLRNKNKTRPTATDATPRNPALDEPVTVPPFPVSSYTLVKTIWSTD